MRYVTVGLTTNVTPQRTATYKGPTKGPLGQKRGPDVNYALIRVRVNPRSGFGGFFLEKDWCLKNTPRIIAPRPYTRSIDHRHPIGWGRETLRDWPNEFTHNFLIFLSF